MIRLVHSRPPQSDVLLEALCKAAHSLVWAEDATTWHRNLSDSPDFDKARSHALDCVEEILRDAEQSHVISGQGVRRLMGVIFDAMTLARWRISGPSLPGLDTASQIAALPRTLRKVWHLFALKQRVVSTLRLAS